MSSAAESTAAAAQAAANAVSQQQTTQQQAPAQTQTPVQNSASSSVPADLLTCQWQNCGERCGTAEQLYDHVCERHVGRKSTNNLNLTCQWGNCRTTTVKRDHITSHIRVHVPLKPHKCDFCGKAFKRPQDLKKHVKTHADDSVLLRSPEPNRAQHGGAGGGYQNAAGKLVADLQSLAASASGYYPDHALGGNPGYYQNGANNPSAYHQATAPQGSAYGPVYYAVNQQNSLGADYEVRKRAAFDALNEFFGDAKRRVIDPNTYYDVGHRLMALSSVPSLLGGAHYGGGADYGAGPQVATASHAPLLQHQYSLPLPNLRTKSDLVNIDQFLEQLQTTVYENSGQAAAAGVAQAGSHYVHPGLHYRSSNSPPHLHQSAHAQGVSNASSLAPLTAAAPTDTPALTPASSVMSYTSGQSPGSVHSGQNVSPITRPSGAGSMYPTLPSVSAMSDMAAPYASATSSAPASGLATAFDSDGRRRYSGGLLQKSAVRAAEDRMDISDDSSSEKTSRQGSAEGLPRDVNRLALGSPLIEPSLRSPAQQSETSENLADKDQESWVENIRVIEHLRAFIKEKLERGQFEEEEGPTPPAGPSDAEREAGSLYPVLRAVQED